MAKILFLGRLKELAGSSELNIDVTPISDISSLIACVAMDNQNLARGLSEPSIRIIINKSVMVSDQDLPAVIDEIAFMPPLSGG